MKKVIALVLASLMVLSVAACGSKEAAPAAPAKTEEAAPAEKAEATTEEAAAPAELYHLRWGGGTTATSAAVWYALQNGYFEAEGVDLEFVFFNGAAALNEAAMADEVDVYSLGATRSINGAITFGAKLIGYLVPDNSTYRIYARSDSAIAKAGAGHIAKYPEILGDADAWQNSTVLLTKGQSNHYFISSIMKELGVDINTVNVMDIEVNQIPVIFKMGEGDVMCVGNPLWAEFAEDPNYTFVGSLDMMYPDYDNVCTVMATDATIARDTTSLQGFMNALMKAQDELAKDPAKYVDAMFDWQSQYNVDVTKEAAEFDTGFYAQPTYDYLKGYFEGGAGSTVADGVFGGIVEFMLGNDQLTQEQYDQFHSMGFVDPTYTMNAIK